MSDGREGSAMREGTKRSPATVALVAVAAIALAGCATFDPPKPWEKQYLAKPSMQFDDDKADARITQHVYQSKEGATGGYGAGGGGCGCN